MSHVSPTAFPAASFLGGLGVADLEALRAASRVRRYRSGELVLREGDASRAVLAILTAIAAFSMLLAAEPVGIAFVAGSISAPGMAESQEHKFPKNDPLRSLFLADRAGGKFETTVNLTVHHGVRTALEYAKSGDIAKARALRCVGTLC